MQNKNTAYLLHNQRSAHCLQVAKGGLDMVLDLPVHIFPHSIYLVPITESELHVYHQDIRIIGVQFWYHAVRLIM